MVFAKKLETLSFFFFSEIGWKKVSSDLVDRKLVILYYKNIVLKKSKILHFFKPWLDHGFWWKIGNFVLYSFLAKQAITTCFVTL